MGAARFFFFLTVDRGRRRNKLGVYFLNLSEYFDVEDIFLTRKTARSRAEKKDSLLKTQSKQL